MHEIICPHCAKAFKIDEAGYADILKQVRDADFEKQLHSRLELAEQDKLNAIELAEAKLASELQRTTATKDAEIQELKSKLDAGDIHRKLAVNEALGTVEKERDALSNELARLRQEKEAEAKLAEAKMQAELRKNAASKEAEIQEFKAKLNAIELGQKLAITEALTFAAHNTS